MKQTMINIVSSFLNWVIQICPPAISFNISKNIWNKLEAYSDSFFSYHLRPKKAEGVEKNVFVRNEDHIAIIIQGPILAENNYTYESILLYKKTFLGSTIILSTWKNQQIKEIEKIKALGISVIQTEQPTQGGPLNINYQIISTIEGIKEAKKQGAKFVYKTRTDQRIYGTDITSSFIALLKSFPIKSQPYLKYKLISPNFTTLKYRPYGIGDMIMFGDIDDMTFYWNAKLDDRTSIDINKIRISIREYSRLRLAETYLCTAFLDKMDYKYNYTLENSWEVYRDFFIIVDNSFIDIHWHKYERFIERRFEYYTEHAFQLMSFKEWLILQNTEISKILIEENLLEEREGVKFKI